MDYSGYRPYNRNYVPSTSNQSNAYGTGRSAPEATPTSTSTAQLVSSSHQQYGSTAYSWADRNPSSYGYLNGNTQNYGSTGWKESQPQQPVYDYQRGQPNYASHSLSHAQSGWYGASTQSLPQSSTQALPQSSTQALSNLAYASGLDAQGQHAQGQPAQGQPAQGQPAQGQPAQGQPAQGQLAHGQQAQGPQGQDDRFPAQSNPGSSQSNTTQRDTHSQSRVKSPLYDLAYSSSNTQIQQTFRPEQSPTSSHRNLAISAAAALAGATDRRYSNSPQQGSVPTQTHQPPPPSVANSGKQNPSDILMSQASHRRVLSHGTNSRGQPQPQPQTQTYSGVPPGPNPPENKYETTETHRYAYTKSHNITLPPPSGTHKSQREPVHAATKLPNHHSSAAVDLREQPEVDARSATTTTITRPVSDNARQQPSEPAVSMPTFIDPSRVFNPYHREHERQKREEAERAKRAEMEPTETNAAERVKDASPAPPVETQVAATAPSTKRQARKAAVKDASIAPPVGTEVTAAAPSIKHQARKAAVKDASVRSSSISSSATGERRDSVDVDMANEMKAMMQRMRELKTKDAMLFQKLWDDMKKGGNGTQAAKGQTPGQSPQTAEVETPRLPPSENLPPSQPSISKPEHAVSQVAATTRKKPPPKTSTSKRYWNMTMVVENNSEALPDLGRFPAERRLPYERRNRRTKEAAEENAREEEPKLTQLAPAPGLPQRALPTTQDEELGRPTNATPEPDVPQAPSVAAPPPASASMDPNGGTVWPEAKRKALAEAAQKALLGLTANKDKSISAADIHALLEQNPSYIELCTKLEARGFVFHRGQFARFLLNNVPDLASPLQAEHPASQQAALPPAHPVKSLPQAISKQTIAPTPIQDTALQNVHSRRSGRLSLENGHPPAQFSYHKVRPPSAPQPKATPIRPVQPRLGVPSPNVPTPVPGSKEANARKRDFSELVDLTQLSDDEDYVMPSKRSRHEASPEPNGFGIQMDNSSLSALGPTPVVQSNFMQTPHEYIHYSPSGLPGGPMPLKPDPRAQSTTVGTLYSQMAPQPSQTMPPRTRHLLAKPLNKAEALRKSYYDPKTVARDILIAAGRHPIEHPLNAHLAGLLGKHIDLYSDLSTFDWDIVDPGGPPMPVVPVVDIPAGPPRWKLGQTRRRGPAVTSEPASNSRAEQRVKLKPRRPVVGTSNSAPKSRGAAKKQWGPRTGVFDSGSKSRGQERVQISERGSVKDTAKEKLNRGQVPDIQTSIARLSSQTKNLLEASFPKPQKASHQPIHLRETKITSIEEDLLLTPSPIASSGGRQNTPHGTKATTSVLSNSPSSERSHKGGRARSHKSSIMAKASPPPMKRPRGRPPGSKKKHGSMPLLKKAARPSGIRLSLSTTRRSLSPQYNVYACQWRKCDAKLHNLPTLRKHIARVHKVSDEEITGEGQPCWWKKCRTLQVNDEEIVPEVTFNSTSDWLDHVDSDHLYPLGLKLGDGPSSAQTDPQTLARDRQLYLSDEQGHSVTAPSTKASIANYPSDTLTLSSVTMNPESNIPNRAFSKAHGNEKMEIKQSAIETLLALQRHKEKVGPGLDRGGVTLVDDERRPTLMHDEGLARVVEGDY